MTYVNLYEFEPKRKLNGRESSQVILTILSLINSSLLCLKDDSNIYQPFMYIIFFGNLLWMAFLIITLVIHIKNRQIRELIINLDIIYWLFNSLLFIWANYLYFTRIEIKRDWDLWILNYMIIGYIFYLSIISSFIFKIIKCITNDKKENLKEFNNLN